MKLRALIRTAGATILALTFCGVAHADKPLCGKLQQGPCPSALTITGIDPLFITVSNGITVQFSFKNNSNQPTSGQVVGDVDGRRLVAEVSANINALGPGGVAQGKLWTNGPGSPGPHTVTLKYQVSTLKGVGPNGPIVSVEIAAETSQDIQVFEDVGPDQILTSLDHQDNLAAATCDVCGKGHCGSTFPTPGIDFGWAEPTPGAIIPVVGTVVDQHIAGNDFPFAHPFGYDYNFFVIPDPLWTDTLNSANQPACSPRTDDCSEKTGDDICRALACARQNYGQALNGKISGVMVSEVEQGLLPADYRPTAGDRVVLYGHRIVDCGHDYHAEIHPPALVAFANTKTQGEVNAKFIAMPYRTQEIYLPDHSPFVTHSLTELGKAANCASGSLDEPPNILTPPFWSSIVGRYLLTIPAKPAGPGSLQIAYHFRARAGVSVAITQPDALHVSVIVTMDKDRFIAAPPPTCTMIRYTWEAADKEAGFVDGAIRSALPGIGLLEAGVNPFCLIPFLAVVEQGPNKLSCTVSPPANLDFAPLNTVSEDNTQPYPLYGDLQLKWVSSTARESTVPSGLLIGSSNGVANSAGIAYHDADGKLGLYYFNPTNDGHFYGRSLKAGQWHWTDQGMPPGTAAAGPSSIVGYQEGTKQRIYAFMRGADGHLYTNYGDGATWQWADQGTPKASTATALSTTTLASAPGVITYPQNGTQRIYAFVQGQDGHLHVNYWDGTRWQWADQGTPGTTTVASAPGVITFPVNGTQRIYAFIQGRDGHLYVNYWDGAAWHWADQGTPGATTAASVPAVITYPQAGGPQRIYAFVRGYDGHLYVNYWDGTTWRWADQNLPAAVTASGAPSAVTVLNGSTQRIDAFVRSQDGHIYANSWDGTTWQWKDLGLPQNVTVLGQPGALAYADANARRIEVLVRGNDGRFYVNAWDGTKGQWVDHTL